MQKQNLVKLYLFVLKILSANENLTSIKAITLLQICKQMTGTNSKLDLANINAHTKFGQVLSICSPAIEEE